MKSMILLGLKFPNFKKYIGSIQPILMSN